MIVGTLVIQINTESLSDDDFQKWAHQAVKRMQENEKIDVLRHSSSQHHAESVDDWL